MSPRDSVHGRMSGEKREVVQIVEVSVTLNFRRTLRFTRPMSKQQIKRHAASIVLADLNSSELQLGVVILSDRST